MNKFPLWSQILIAFMGPASTMFATHYKSDMGEAVVQAITAGLAGLGSIGLNKGLKQVQARRSTKE